MENLTEKQIKRFWDNVDKKGDDECWEWKGYIQCQGYGTKAFGNGNDIFAHRISYYLANGYLPNEPLIIRHKCKTKCCVNPNHLESGTQKQNMEDKRRDGTAAIGFRHGKAVLTDAQVLEIRAKYVPNFYTCPKLAEEYKSAISTIHRIVTYKTMNNI